MPRTRLTLCLLACALFLGACGDDAPDASPLDPQKVLALHVFDALKHDDVGRLESVLLTTKDMEWMLERVEESASAEARKTIQDLVATEGGPAALATSRREKAQDAFRTARASSAKVLDWTNAQFVEVIDAQSRPVVENGVEGAAIHFVVKSGEREELFVIKNAMNVRGTWMAAQGVKHQRSPHASMTDARIQQTKQHLKGFETVIRLYAQDHGRLPTGMEEFFEESPSMKNPYLTKGYGDSWGNPFAYTLLGPDAWQVRSPGPDGILDTEDDITWPEPSDK